MAFDPDAYLESVSSVSTPTDLDSEFDPDAYLKSVTQEGLGGDIIKSFEVGARQAELRGRAGSIENLVKVAEQAAPTYYSTVPMMGAPTMSPRQMEEEGIEPGKPIGAPDQDLMNKSLLSLAEDLRVEADAMGSTVGLDSDFEQSFPGQVIKGMGQFAPVILYGLIGGLPGLATQISGQMDTEALQEAERTTGKKFADMSDEEQSQTNLTRFGQQIIGTGLNMFAFSKLLPTGLKSKVNNFLTKKGLLKKNEFQQVVNTLRKDVATSMLAEGSTETAEAFSLDLLTKFSGLDSRREILSLENVRENMYQGLVGSFSAGGTTTIAGGSGKLMAKIGNIEVPVGETPAVSETELGNKKQFSVKYTKDGQEVISDPIEADSLEGAQNVVEESVGKLDGVPKESIIVSEIKVEPKVDPTVEPEAEAPETPQERLAKTFAVSDLANELYTKATGEKYAFRTGDRDLYLEMEAEAEKILKNKEAVEPEVETEVGTDFAPTETVGIFGEDVDLDTMDLTAEQKADILAIREQVRAEAKEIITALDDTTEDTTAGASQLDPVNEFKVRRAQEQATKDAPYKPKRRKELYAKLRELDKRAFDALATVNPFVRERGYTPTSEQDYDSEIDMRLEDAAYMATVPQVSAAGVRSPIAGASPIQISNATTNRDDGRVVEENGKVTKLVPDGEKLYEIKTRVTTSVRGSTKAVGKPSAEFQPVIRYVTAKSSKEARQKYKDTPDPAIDEQKKDSRANYPSNVQDQLSQRATSEVKEIKDYDNNDKAIIRNLRDSSGFVFLPDTEFGIDPLIRGEQPIVAASQKQQQSQQQGVIAEAVANLQKLADKLGVKVVARTDITRDAQYNYETQTIEYNPELLAKRGSEGSKAALREEAIHAAMHKVIMKRYPKLSARAAFEKAMANIGKDLTTEQKLLLQEVYGELDTDTDFGAEYSRFAIQQILDGKTTEGTMFEGKAMEKVKSLIKSVQSYLTRIMGPELESNKEAAFIIADSIKLLQSVDPNARPVNQKIVDKANSVLEETNSLDASRITNPANVPEGKLPSYQKRQMAKLLSQAGRKAKRFLQTASMFFRDIHVEIQTELVRHFNKIDTAQTEATRVLRSFQLGLIGIKNKKDKKRLQVLLTYSPNTDSVNNSERDTLINERNALLRKYNLLNDFNLLVRPLLDKLHQQAIASGQDVNYLFEYYPRRVKDLEGLMNYYGQAVSEDFVEYLKIENKRRQGAGEIQIVTMEQKAVELQKYLRKKSFVNSSKIPANFKTRTSNMLTEAELEFYEDPSKALGQYVSSIIVANAEQELLGKARNATTTPVTIDGKNQNVIDLEDSSGSLPLKIVELLDRGEIDNTKFLDLQYGLTQLFGPNKSSENMFFEMSRTFSYGSLLVQPTTTLSQLYDIAFISMDNNIARVMATLFTKKDFTLRMAGINTSTVSAEFVTDPKGRGVKKFMNDAVRTMLKAGGFTRMDQLLKETNLTTNYNRMKRVSKLSPNSRAYKNLRKELIYMQGEADADLTLGDLKQGIHDSPRVREAIVRKLLETQPINRLEMPLVVSDNPNWRMAYTMKSFVIKQANLVGNRYLAVIFSTKSSLGEKKDAILGLMYLAFLFQLVGFPIDILKALISGRDIYQNDIAVDGLFRIAGISSFTIGKFADDPFGTVASFVAPVNFSQGYQMSNDFIKVRDGEQSFMDPFLKLSPYSNVWYYRYGPGVFKEDKKRFYKRRAGELPIYRDDPLGDAVITPMKEAIYDPALKSIMDLIKQ